MDSSAPKKMKDKKTTQKKPLPIYQTVINAFQVHRVGILFFITWILIVCLKFLQFPSLTVRPEMFAENATNFFINAYTKDLLHNLVSLDAGYLPLIQRIIAVVLVKVFHTVTLYPLVTQWIAIAFIATFCSFFILSEFRKLIASDLARAFIALSLSMVSDYEINTFINFIYFGGIYLLLMIFINKEKLSLWLVSLLGIGAGLVFCSKGVYVVFLPLYLTALCYSLFKKKKHSLVFYASSFIFGSLQAVILLNQFVHTSHTKTSGVVTYGIYGVKTLYYLLLTYRHVLLGAFTSDKGYILSLILIMVLIILGIRCLIHNKNTYLIKVFIIGNLLACFSLYLTIVLTNTNISFISSLPQIRTNTPSIQNESEKKTVSDYSRNESSVLLNKHYANLRNMFFSNMSIYFVSLILLLAIVPKRRYQLLVLGFILYSSGSFGQVNVEEHYPSNTDSYSQWKIFSPLLKNENYCIPINPYDQVLSNQCQKIALIDHADSTINQSWKIQSIIVINDKKKGEGDVLYAFSPQKKLVATATRMTPWTNRYVYFLFNSPVSGVESLAFTLEAYDNKSLPPALIYGMDK